MRYLKNNTLSYDQIQGVFKLWNQEYPSVLNYSHLTDFQHYIDHLEAPLHRLILHDHRVLAWLVEMNRHEERWFIIIVHNMIQGQGLGRQLLIAAMEENEQLLGWVVDQDRYLKSDGSTYKSPLLFYQKMGFDVTDERLVKNGLSTIKISYTRK